MKLYDGGRAPNPRRVRIFLAEKGVTVPTEQVDLGQLQQRSDAFTALNPMQRVPALVLDDGTVITESIAICRYLEALRPAPNLFGRDAKETAVIEMWTRRAEHLTAVPLMLAVRHGHPALAALETQVPEVAANNRQQADRSLALFDRRLAESEWLGADRITVADGVLFVGFEFARLVRFAIPEALTNLTRWQKAMRERASATAGT